MGALGAAIATAVSYFEVWAFRYWHSRRYIKIKIKLFRDILSYILLIFQSVFILVNVEYIYVWIFEIFAFILILTLYYRDILMILNKIKNH